MTPSVDKNIFVKSADQYHPKLNIFTKTQQNLINNQPI